MLLLGSCTANADRCICIHLLSGSQQNELGSVNRVRNYAADARGNTTQNQQLTQQRLIRIRN